MKKAFFKASKLVIFLSFLPISPAFANQLVPISVGNILIFVPVNPSKTNSETITYSYDELGRLIKVDNGNKQQDYDYDDAGNRKSVVTTDH